MATRVRLDRELVRRGLAPSREAATAAIRDGRVLVAGTVAAKPSTLVSRRRPGRPGRPGPALGQPRWRQAGPGPRAARRAPWPGGAAWTPAPPPAASPTCCWRPGRPRWWPSTSATASSSSACGRTRGSGCSTGPTCASLDAELVGGPVDLTVADLSFISLRLVLPVLAGLTRRRRRPGAAGQAPVRGRPGGGRPRRGGPRPGGQGGRRPRRRRGRPGRSGSGWAGSAPRPSPARPATWSCSSTSAPGRRSLDETALQAALAEGAALPGSGVVSRRGPGTPGGAPVR